MSLLASLKTMVESKKVAGSGVLCLDNATDRMQVSLTAFTHNSNNNKTPLLTLFSRSVPQIIERVFTARIYGPNAKLGVFNPIEKKEKKKRGKKSQ